MDEKILRIVADMSDFIGEFWSEFLNKMEEKGFTEAEVDEMNERLSEFLANNGYG